MRLPAIGLANLRSEDAARVQRAVGTSARLVEVRDPPGELEMVIVGSPEPRSRLDAWLATGLPVLLFVETRDVATELTAMDMGIAGYLLRAAAPDTLGKSITAALNGELVFSRVALAQWVERDRHRQPTGNPLSTREREVLDLIAEGATNREIAARLGIMPATAEKHVSRLLHKLGATNRADAVALTRYADRLIKSEDCAMDGREEASVHRED